VRRLIQGFARAVSACMIWPCVAGVGRSRLPTAAADLMARTTKPNYDDSPDQEDSPIEAPLVPGPTESEAPPLPDAEKPARSRKRKSPVFSDAPVDLAAQESTEAAGGLDAAEQADGAVDDSEEQDQDASGAIEVPAIDVQPVEALLFSTHHPLTAPRLSELLKAGTKSIRRAIKSLNEQYEATGRSFRIEQVAGGYQILTLPEFGEILQKLHQKEADAKLTKAALETLAIVAYKQPALRADVEAIRGVACGETIRSLMEKHLVKIAGRAEEPGRPILYGTTKRFLELFGLNTLKDLPQPEGEMQPKTLSPAIVEAMSEPDVAESAEETPEEGDP
jgi:segregation and condensation protein B